MMTHDEKKIYLERLKHQLPESVLITLLDIVEPVAPLAAQLLWAMQPAAGLFGEQAMVKFLAQTLEDPDGILQLRTALEKQES